MRVLRGGAARVSEQFDQRRLGHRREAYIGASGSGTKLAGMAGGALTNTTPLIGNAGGGLIGNAGAGLIGNAGSGLGPVSALSDVEPLTADAGLIGNAGAALAGSSGGALIGNAGSGLIGREIQTVGAVAYAEAIDGSTGKLLLRVRVGSDGRYRLDLGRVPVRGGLILQVTAVEGSAVKGYLAAPLPLAKGQTGTRRVDTTPASTLIAFSSAVMAGVSKEFDVRYGFRGFKAAGLAKLLPYGDAAKADAAARALDAADTYAKAAKLDDVLGQAAKDSGVLAGAAIGTSAKAGKSVAALIAASN
ncbi:MAG: hypothetical protein FJZ00_07960, partial [Candidatus Sericytochromatia bacterium]|nr:hypothetical protein [Candidatus Tanganyikabacteria bacterium]